MNIELSDASTETFRYAVLNLPAFQTIMYAAIVCIMWFGGGFILQGDMVVSALSDITLHIPAGATVGIIGGTGSAKTTLVQLIPRLYDATEGTVKVGGRDVRDYDLTGPAGRRRHCAAKEPAVLRHHPG